MKILQIYRRFEDSGPGTQPVELAKYFRQRGHDVWFASSGGQMVGEINALGFPFVEIETLAIDRRDPVSTIRSTARLRELIRSAGIDVIHGHNAAATATAALANLLIGKRAKMFQSVRGLDADKAWRNWIYRLPFAHLFAVCDFTRAWLLRLGVPPDRITLTYNGVDTVRFRPDPEARRAIREELGIPQDALVVGNVGAFSGLKGQHLIVGALDRLRQFARPVYAVFVGDGSSYGGNYFESTKNLARELNVDGRCRFVGFRRDIPALQASFDVYCHPSTEGEMFPNAILEAMASGNAWVGSAISGIPEIAAASDAAVLVPPSDEERVADALATLLVNEELRRRYGDRARVAAIEKFSLDAVGGRILRAYESDEP